MKVPVVMISRGHRSQFSFNLRHAMPFGPEKDQYSHAHDYELIVAVKGPVNPETGFVMDAGELKKIVLAEVVEYLDGQDANQFMTNPTSENLIVAIWEMLESRLPNLFEIELWETPKICFSYRGEEVEIDE